MRETISRAYTTGEADVAGGILHVHGRHGCTAVHTHHGCICVWAIALFLSILHLAWFSLARSLDRSLWLITSSFEHNAAIALTPGPQGEVEESKTHQKRRGVCICLRKNRYFSCEDNQILRRMQVLVKFVS